MTVTEMNLACLRALARRLARNEAGASFVEYGLLLALIAVACVAAVTVIGQSNQSSLSSTASVLD